MTRFYGVPLKHPPRSRHARACRRRALNYVQPSRWVEVCALIRAHRRQAFWRSLALAAPPEAFILPNTWS